MNIIEEIKNNCDVKYGEFTKKIIGKQKSAYLRINIAKQIAKKYSNTNEAIKFLDMLPHKNIDQNNVHGLIIGYLKEEALNVISKLKKFLPYIDNWATCDITVSNLKIIKKEPQKFKIFAKNCIKSNKSFIKRFGIVILLTYFLDDNFEKKDLKEMASIYSDDYYVNMALSWYFSVAFVKQYKSAIKIFQESHIKNKWVHNKSIQKVCDSLRVNSQQKSYLKSLKR